MTITWILVFFVTFGSIGSAALLVAVIVMWRTGLIAAFRNSEGEIKKKADARMIAAPIIMLLFYIAFLMVSDYFGIKTKEVQVSFAALLGLNYGLFTILVLFDTFIIDILIVVKMRPAFLELPDSEAHNSALYHIKTIPKALVFGIPLTLIASFLSQLILKMSS